MNYYVYFWRIEGVIDFYKQSSNCFAAWTKTNRIKDATTIDLMEYVALQKSDISLEQKNKAAVNYSLMAHIFVQLFFCHIK